MMSLTIPMKCQDVNVDQNKCHLFIKQGKFGSIVWTI